MKYKVGDKVRVKKDLEKDIFYGEHRFEEEQEEFKGESAIINNVNKASNYYDLDIDCEEFYWTDEMLEPIAESIAESVENTDKVSTNSVESIDNFSLKDLKFGDIVTLRNGDILIFTGIATMRNSEDMEFGLRNYDDINLEYDNSEEFDIMKVERTKEIEEGTYEFETLYERKEILDEKEKEYLSKIIEPLRDTKIDIVEKVGNTVGQSIKICYRTKSEYGDLFGATVLPPFKTDTMYKGMEIDKEYTLKELGL